MTNLVNVKTPDDAVNALKAVIEQVYGGTPELRDAMTQAVDKDRDVFMGLFSGETDDPSGVGGRVADKLSLKVPALDIKGGEVGSPQERLFNGAAEIFRQLYFGKVLNDPEGFPGILDLNKFTANL